MPLSVLIRNADGSLTTDELAKRGYTASFLPLDGDISPKDYGVYSNEESDRFHLRHKWLNATFDVQTLWFFDDRNFDDFKRELAEFLNDPDLIKGPYYAAEDPVEGKVTVFVILFRQDDIDTFAERYPEWKYHRSSAQLNAETLGVWQRNGRELDTPALYEFAAMLDA